MSKFDSKLMAHNLAAFALTGDTLGAMRRGLVEARYWVAPESVKVDADSKMVQTIAAHFKADVVESSRGVLSGFTIKQEGSNAAKMALSRARLFLTKDMGEQAEQPKLQLKTRLAAPILKAIASGEDAKVNAAKSAIKHAILALQQAGFSL